MPARRRLISGMVLLMGFALACYGRWFSLRSRAPEFNARAALGRQLPSLPATDASGHPADIAEAIRGRRSVIAFYSASCDSCRAVLPELKPFPVTLNLVLVNEEAGSPIDIRSTLGLETAWLYHDRNDVLARSFPPAAIPTILFVDENGVLRDGLVGQHADGLIHEKLQVFAAGGS